MDERAPRTELQAYIFNPQVMAHLETTWFLQLHERLPGDPDKTKQQMLQEHFGLSPVYAAIAVGHENLHDMLRKTPDEFSCIRNYYQILRNQSGLNFNVEHVAAAEMSYWQALRSEGTGVERISAAMDRMADMFTAIYGLNDPDQLRTATAARMRALFCLGSEMWDSIEPNLLDYYQQLKAAVNPRYDVITDLMV